VIGSGLWFYLYNELSTIVIKKTNAVTMSVLNTAKRVIVIVCVAIVMGESLGFLKLLGCSIGIAGVFLYSIIDDLVAKFKSKKSSGGDGDSGSIDGSGALDAFGAKSFIQSCSNACSVVNRLLGSICSMEAINSFASSEM